MQLTNLRRLIGRTHGRPMGAVRFLRPLTKTQIALTRQNARKLVETQAVKFYQGKGTTRHKPKKEPVRSAKRTWITRIRSHRALLRANRDQLTTSAYRTIYRRLKSGVICTKKKLLRIIHELQESK